MGKRICHTHGRSWDGIQCSESDLRSAFLEINCVIDHIREIKPAEIQDRCISEEEFGDNWSDLLERDDKKKVDQYFREIP